MENSKIISLGELNDRVLIYQLIAAEKLATRTKLMIGVAGLALLAGYITGLIHFSFNVVPEVVKSWYGV